MQSKIHFALFALVMTVLSTWGGVGISEAQLFR